MTVFKTFLKILNKNKFVVIMYTVILLIFGGFNMKTSDNNVNFISEKPNIAIINNDNEALSRNMFKYLDKNCNIIKLANQKEKLNDALFYREVSYIIYIPKNYSEDFLNGKNPHLKIKTTKDYEAEFANMLVKRYLEVITTYQKLNLSEQDLINNTNSTLDKKTKVKITSKINTSSLEKTAYYFNFASYSILACLIYVICLILTIFNSDHIRKRTITSSTNYKKNNKYLLLSNLLYSLIVWFFYVVLGFILIKDTIISLHSLCFILNSLLFTICATSIAFLLGNLISKKESITGIMNVVALGSSFLCGAFVPQEMLPSFVLKLAHLLPTYYYISSNNSLTTIESFTTKTLEPILINSLIMLIYIIVFMLLANIVVKKKRKLG